MALMVESGFQIIRVIRDSVVNVILVLDSRDESCLAHRPLRVVESLW